MIEIGDALTAMPLPDPEKATDKDSRGRGLVVGSSSKVPGAAILSGEAFLRAGAGKVQLCVPTSLSASIGASFPESGIISFDDFVPTVDDLANTIQAADCTLIGPGLDDKNGTSRLIDGIFRKKWKGSFVLDAMALHDLWSNRDIVGRSESKIVITPHHGEMATLLNIPIETISSQPLHYAREVSQELKAVVVLKAGTTYIASPDGRYWKHSSGCIGLATAGSGDVLAGILAGLLSRGADLVTASLWAVTAHAKAGQMLTAHYGKTGFLARELIPLIPMALARN